MTNDELLANIDYFLEYEPKESQDWASAGIFIAKKLRAAVEATQLENPAPISPAFGDGWRTAMLTVFGAIEKELDA